MQRNPHEAAATIEHWINVFDNELPEEVSGCTHLADMVKKLRRHLGQLMLDIDAGDEAMHIAAQAFASDWSEEADDLFVQSTAECEQGKQASTQAWRSWCAMALTGGAGPGHRWSKANSEWVPSTTLSRDGRVIADPLALLAAEAKTLHSAWGASYNPVSQVDFVHLAPRTLGQAFPAHRIRAASKTFSPRTATTYDGVHPRHFSLLRDEGLEAVGKLLQIIETLGGWPRQTALVSTVLLPKPKGGWRGIGLFPALHRLYTRSCQPIFRQWELQTWRPYFAATSGKGPERVVWRQALASEAEGSISASVLWDLCKFFEHLCLTRLYCRGLAADFPRLILRTLCSAYRFGRVVSGAAGMTVPVWASCGVTPGCGAASVMIRAYCMAPLDNLCTQLLSMPCEVTLDVYYDDMHISAKGRDPTTVAKTTVDSARALKRTVDEDLLCSVAPAKGGSRGEQRQHPQAGDQGHEGPARHAAPQLCQPGGGLHWRSQASMGRCADAGCKAV